MLLLKIGGWVGILVVSDLVVGISNGVKIGILLRDIMRCHVSRVLVVIDILETKSLAKGDDEVVPLGLPAFKFCTLRA